LPPRARSQEVIRQRRNLRQHRESKFGRSAQQLADVVGIGKRTIHRDIVALQEAGFPLEPKERGDRKVWTLNRDAFTGLIAAGLTLPELCALYFSRALLEYLTGTFFQKDLQSAFAKFEDCLTLAQQEYLDQIPKVVAAKPEPKKKTGTDVPGLVGRLVSAALEHRPISMMYDSRSSRKVNTYAAEPYGVVYGHGGLYLVAYVPAYRELRLFAVERIKKLTVRDGQFTPSTTAAQAIASLGDSLGINLGGRPEPVVIEFQPEAAPYVLEREFHPSQTLETAADGSVMLKMKVVVDWGLSAWVMGFGPRARVIAPRRLAQQVYANVEEMRDLYAPRMPLDLPTVPKSAQRGLPFPARKR
jgi:predicted DNA-binding transcriptional regulator YafY